MIKDPCKNCGSVTYYRWHKSDLTEHCNECHKLIPAYPRDSAGNKVSVPAEHLGKYSYATGTIINSARSYADHLKKNNLMLKKA